MLETKLRDSNTNIFKNVQNVMMLFEKTILKWIDIYIKKNCNILKISLTIVVLQW